MLIRKLLSFKDCLKLSFCGCLYCAVVSLSIALVITTIGIFNAPYLMQILGAKDEYLLEALSYIDIILFGAIFYVGVFFTNALLNSLRNTKAFRNFLIVGFFLNIILDYWFIKGGFGIKPMGVRGIGYATIVIEFLGFIYLFSILKKLIFFKIYQHSNLIKYYI